MFKQGDSSNNGTRDFSDSLPFERSLCFYVTITEIFEHFNILTWKKTKSFFKKLKYCFLVEITEIESATFPCKTARSEAMLKQIEWGVQNGPIRLCK